MDSSKINIPSTDYLKALIKSHNVTQKQLGDEWNRITPKETKRASRQPQLSRLFKEKKNVSDLYLIYAVSILVDISLIDIINEDENILSKSQLLTKSDNIEDKVQESYELNKKIEVLTKERDDYKEKYELQKELISLLKKE